MNPTKSKKIHCCPEKIEAARVLIFVNGTDKELHFWWWWWWWRLGYLTTLFTARS